MNVNPPEFVVILNNLIFWTTTISFSFNYHYFRAIKHIVSLDTQLLMGFQVPCKLPNEISVSRKMCLNLGCFFLLCLDKVLGDKVVVIEVETQ